MTYRVTDMRFPKNVICLEYLVKLSRDLGLCDLEVIKGLFINGTVSVSIAVVCQ